MLLVGNSSASSLSSSLSRPLVSSVDSLGDPLNLTITIWLQTLSAIEPGNLIRLL